MLRAVRHEGLVAVVSDAPESLRPKRRDLVEHEAVIGRCSAAGTVLPMRFGMVAPDDEAVQTELDRGRGVMRELLSRLDGHVELNVKGAHAEEALLADLLQNAELRARNEALRAAGGGGHQDKVAFGEQVAAAVERAARA